MRHACEEPRWRLSPWGRNQKKAGRRGHVSLTGLLSSWALISSGSRMCCSGYPQSSNWARMNLADWRTDRSVSARRRPLMSRDVAAAGAGRFFFFLLGPRGHLGNRTMRRRSSGPCAELVHGPPGRRLERRTSRSPPWRCGVSGRPGAWSEAMRNSRPLVTSLGLPMLPRLAAGPLRGVGIPDCPRVGCPWWNGQRSAAAGTQFQVAGVSPRLRCPGVSVRECPCRPRGVPVDSAIEVMASRVGTRIGSRPRRSRRRPT